jgi:oligopeptide/dipeptide ABC transporter, ATP-binding protein, C-terminal domain
MSEDVLLSVKDLSVEYEAGEGSLRAVDRVSFEIHRGEFFGLAGESGCGKSTIAFAILRLLKGAARVPAGAVEFKGRDLLLFGREQMRLFRWKEASMVLQSAMNNLNPVVTIGSQLVDAILAHERMGKDEALDRVAELLAIVNISPDRAKSYPHELSGGMRQRVVIAMALALKPDLVIFDEPTTALDVVVQYNIIRRVLELKEKMGFSVLFITHDLPLMLEICDRIGIMYAGRMAEIASTEDLREGPWHPYAAGLLRSFPSLIGPKTSLRGIPGSVPDLVLPPAGCLFAERCERRSPACEAEPAYVPRGLGGYACWNPMPRSAR